MISPEIIASLKRGSEIRINAGLYDEFDKPVQTHINTVVVTDVFEGGVNAATVREDGRLAMPGGFPFNIIAEPTGRTWSEEEIRQGFAWIFDH